tara:strand:- start:695 stop:838 length:144 start_codon:yes stop_codon:yes gene_type:complete
MSIVEIKTAIRHHLTLLAEAAMKNDHGTAGKHFDEIMKLTDELNNHV